MRLRISFLALAVSLVAMFATTASAAADQPTPTYWALGDSYASGYGILSPNSGPLCYQSSEAYPPLIAAADGYDLGFAACSGAVTSGVPGPFSVTGQLQGLVSQGGPAPNLVTVQVGGDDVHFRDTVIACLTSTEACTAAVDAGEMQLKTTLPAALDTAYTAIRSHAPNAKVVVLGYPRLFLPNQTKCESVPIPTLTRTSIRELNTAANLLDATIRRQAVRYGFKFVDPRGAFTTHGICSTTPWMNGLLYLLTGSFHPNAAGEAAFATLIEHAL